MATKLDGNRAVTRQTIGTVDDRGTARALLATLAIGDKLELRPLGTRRVTKTYNLIDLYDNGGLVKLTSRIQRETVGTVRDLSKYRTLTFEAIPGDTFRIWPTGVEAAARELTIAEIWHYAGILKGRRDAADKKAARKNGKG